MKILEKAFRLHVEAERFESSVKFYEELQSAPCERRVVVPETGVTAAKVGSFLILGGSQKDIEAVRYVDAIFYLDSLDEFASWLTSQNIEIIHAPRVVTGGKNLTARHQDGLVVEYFQAASASKPLQEQA